MSKGWLQLLVGAWMSSLTVLALDVLPYGAGNWTEGDRGNHRAVVEVSDAAEAAKVVIPWRRRDRHPERKAVLVYAPSGREVANVLPLNITSECGTVAFEPTEGAGTYHCYYLPYKEPTDWKGDAGSYYPPRDTVSQTWKKKARQANIPAARAVRLESRTAFDSFFPMEVPATDNETRQFLAGIQERWAVFTESRENPIRMLDRLPRHWLDQGEAHNIQITARPNEFFAIQLGVYALEELRNVRVSATALQGTMGEKDIPADAFSCVNQDGLAPDGRTFHNKINVPKANVQPLWILLKIPAQAKGRYLGKLHLTADDTPSRTLPIELAVEGEPLADHGFADIGNMSRIAWLNSACGLERRVYPPYQPVKATANTLDILDRTARFHDNGLPHSIVSRGEELLTRPAELIVSPGTLKFTPCKVTLEDEVASRVEGTSTSSHFTVVHARTMEYDGCIIYEYRIIARKDVSNAHAQVRFYLDAAQAPYAMGMGLRGGRRPSQRTWQRGDKGTDSFWLGNVNAGMQLKLEKGLDKLELASLDGGIQLIASTPSQLLRQGESLTFRFRLLLTPFKPIDQSHWNWRMESQWGGNYAGWNMSLLFHGDQNCGNTYINYPFLENRAMREFVKAKRAQAKKAQAKCYGQEDDSNGFHPRGYTPVLYYTVRELSNRAAELWVMRSLADEIFAGTALITQPDGSFSRGPGGGHPWLQEHLMDGYAPSWRMPFRNKQGQFNDASVAIARATRWHNYYVEGWRYLIRNCGVQGLYLDGIGFDRTVMRRMANVMHQELGRSFVEIHNGNDYDFNDWRTSPADTLMAHFPYTSKLWFGEMYSYDRDPAYWLVEISGLPFGLTGEMLNYGNGGNIYRGMVYGMNSRMHAATSPLWKFWDDFRIQDATWLGYWEKNCPVQPNRPDIKLSVFRKKNEAAIAFAHWPSSTGRRLAVSKLSASPALLGELDRTWQGISSESGFQIVGNKGKVDSKYATSFRMAQDGTFLYIGLECHAPDLRPPAPLPRDGEVWASDSVDLYLSCGKNSIHFIGDSGGNVYDIKNGEKSWNGDWQYQTQSHKDCWTATLRLPLVELGQNPKTIKGNVCRTSKNGTLLSAWSPCTTYGDTARFGEFLLPGVCDNAKASSTHQDSTVVFHIDWKSLGMDRDKAELVRPAIPSFQTERRFKVSDRIPFSESQGGILLIKGK